MDDFEKIFIQNARYIAKEKGIAFAFIEKACGLFQGYFTKSFQKGRSVSLNSAIRISNCLNVSLKDLLDPNLEKQYILQEYKEKLYNLKKQEEEILAKIKEIES